MDEYDKRIETLKAKRKSHQTIPRYNGSGKESNAKKDNQKMNDDEDEEEMMLLEDIGIKEEDVKEDSDREEKEEKYRPVKIFVCSRTHSQLSQLVGEIIKSPFSEETRSVSLASRQNYCINSSVTKLRSIALINERCLDMQKKAEKSTKTETEGKVTKRQKSQTSGRCPYNKQQNIDELCKYPYSTYSTSKIWLRPPRKFVLVPIMLVEKLWKTHKLY